MLRIKPIKWSNRVKPDHKKTKKNKKSSMFQAIYSDNTRHAKKKKKNLM